ncbi:MAG: hypothetical protein HQ513_06000, partial [Rhodospirillales bacterium]|nr:hypothetical protein [Rhodospirillales bacterium]
MTTALLYRRFFHAVLLGVVLLVPLSLNAQEEDVAGIVVRMQGNAVAMQDALPRVLKVGDKILRGD